MEGKVRRALDIREGEDVEAAAFTALVQEAVAVNGAKPTQAKSAKKFVKQSEAQRE
jgi:hypothetical protein